MEGRSRLQVQNSSGLNPIVSQIWNKYRPLPNDPQAGDRFDTKGYLTPLRLPVTSNFAVGRIDHDFGQNWRLMTSYRYYKVNQFTNSQVDIGGLLPGDTFGTAAAKSQKPQTSSYWVDGLNGVITPHLINDCTTAICGTPGSGVPPRLPRSCPARRRHRDRRR